MRVTKDDLTDNVTAFLKMLRWSEDKNAPSDEARYNKIVGGSTFDDFSDHPRRMQHLIINGKTVSSDAAGAYQFLSTTFDFIKHIVGRDDFTPEAQDLYALQQIQINGSLDDIKSGDLITAIKKNSKTWASFPGNDYDQNPNTFDALQQQYADAGGTVNNQTA